MRVLDRIQLGIRKCTNHLGRWKMYATFQHSLCSTVHQTRNELQQCTRDQLRLLQLSVAEAIGPRQEGGVYRSGWSGLTYRVASIKEPTPSNIDWFLVLVWEDGHRTSSRTAWRTGYDEVVWEPHDAPTVDLRIGTAVSRYHAAPGIYAEYGR